MLLELAIGDAYGAGFEYADDSFIQRNNTLTTYVQHPRHREIKPGDYTDDTQMSIAVAEVIVSGDDWTPLNLAESFVRAFKRDERTGYTGGFYGFLKSIKDGTEFLEKIKPDSDKSGAAMRAAPIGIFPTVQEVVEKCTVQAALTHNTSDGINAAVAASLMTHYFLYDLGDKAQLGEFLESHVPGKWNKPYQGKVGSKGWMSTQAAVTAVMRNDRLGSLLKDCINFRGDVDTIATIALAAASCSREYLQDLPENLVATLENRAFGRDYLVELDAKLLALVR